MNSLRRPMFRLPALLSRPLRPCFTGRPLIPKAYNHTTTEILNISASLGGLPDEPTKFINGEFLSGPTQVLSFPSDVANHLLGHKRVRFNKPDRFQLLLYENGTILADTYSKVRLSPPYFWIYVSLAWLAYSYHVLSTTGTETDI